MAAVRWVTLKQPVQTRRHLLLAAMTVVAMIVVAMIVEDSKTASRRFS